jgi:hypothetical protein
MSQRPPLDILGTFQDPLGLDQGASKLTNVRVVPREAAEVASSPGAPAGKAARVRFVGAPGLTPRCHPTTSPCLVLAAALGTLWSGHADGTIWYGVETATPVLSGTVAVDPTQPIIRFAEDRTALAIATNRNVLGGTRAGTGYVATQGGGVVNCGFDTSINFDPSAVAELDNMTLWSGASNFYASQDAKVYRSQPLAPANVLPNSWGTKEARPDRVVDLAVSGRVLWPLGARSLEQWYDSGANTDMPFVPYPNSLVSVGIAARLSRAVLRDLIVFVATDLRVWVCTGQSGKPVSPPWVDLLLQELTLAQLQQLTAYAYGQGGSDFYVLTLPGQWTIEMSAAGLWSYRQSPGRLDHAGRCAKEYDGGTTFVGLDTGEICALDLNSASEPAGVIEREIITPWVTADDQFSTVNSLSITSSMGPSAGQFQLDWADNRAVTWRGLRNITFPLPGTRRAIARNFGSSRRQQFRFRYSGTQAPFTIDEWFADID